MKGFAVFMIVMIASIQFGTAIALSMNIIPCLPNADGTPCMGNPFKYDPVTKQYGMNETNTVYSDFKNFANNKSYGNSNTAQSQTLLSGITVIVDMGQTIATMSSLIIKSAITLEGIWLIFPETPMYLKVMLLFGVYVSYAILIIMILSKVDISGN